MKVTKERMALAIEDSFGIVSVIAKKLDVQRKTVYEWINRHPEIQAMLQDEREKLVDTTEVKLVQKITEGDSKCITYVLSTLGKSRGYTTQTEIKLSGTIEQKIIEMTPEEREKRKNELLKKVKGTGE